MPIHQAMGQPRWQDTPPDPALRALRRSEEGEPVMAYGHAERNLAVIRRLEAETEQLIRSLEQPIFRSHEQPFSDESAWPEDRPQS
jgi:hypothetical protein